MWDFVLISGVGVGAIIDFFGGVTDLYLSKVLIFGYGAWFLRGISYNIVQTSSWSTGLAVALLPVGENRGVNLSWALTRVAPLFLLMCKMNGQGPMDLNGSLGFSRRICLALASRNRCFSPNVWWAQDTLCLGRFQDFTGLDKVIYGFRIYLEDVT